MAVPRAGDVLLRVYAKCISGQQAEAKRRIEEATRPREDQLRVTPRRLKLGHVLGTATRISRLPAASSRTRPGQETSNP